MTSMFIGLLTFYLNILFHYYIITSEVYEIDKRKWADMVLTVKQAPLHILIGPIDIYIDPATVTSLCSKFNA